MQVFLWRFKSPFLCSYCFHANVLIRLLDQSLCFNTVNFEASVMHVIFNIMTRDFNCWYIFSSRVVLFTLNSILTVDWPWVNIWTDWSIIFNYLKLYLLNWCKVCQAAERCSHTSKLPIFTSKTLLRKIETWLDISLLVVPNISFKSVWKQRAKKIPRFPIQIERILSTGLWNILIAISTI